MLLNNVREWHQAIEEAAEWGSISPELRQLFDNLVMHLHSNVGDLVKLPECYRNEQRDDIVHGMRNILNTQNMRFPHEHLKNHVLFEHEKIFNLNATSLVEFKLPMHGMSLLENVSSR